MSNQNKMGAGIPGVNPLEGMKKQFPVTKTLAFRLVPHPATEKYITANPLQADQQLTADYLTIKDAADRIHKAFIETTMRPFRLKYTSDGKKDSLEEYIAYSNSTDKDKDFTSEVKSIKAALKAQIVAAFKKVPSPITDNKTMLQDLCSEKLVKKFLKEEQYTVLSPDEAMAVSRMCKCTSRMRPYMEARNRMYVETNGNTIPNRIVEDNLPIFFDNAGIFAGYPAEIVEKAKALFDYMEERFEVSELAEVFHPSSYPQYCAQSAISAYNDLIGGFNDSSQSRVQGINEIIKEYLDIHSDEKISYLKKLKKQILSDRVKISWLPPVYNSDEEVIDTLENLEKNSWDLPMASTVRAYDPDGVYINMKFLSSYSRAVYGNGKEAEYAIRELLEAENPKGKRQGDKSYAVKIDRLYKKFKHVSVGYINKAVALMNGTEETNPLQIFINSHIIKPLEDAEVSYDKAMTERKANPKIPLGQDPENGKQNAGSYVKEYLENMTSAKRAAFTFVMADKGETSDNRFVDDILDPFKKFSDFLVPTYKGVQAYLTRKPNTGNKIPLFFETPQFLGGWDKDVWIDKRGLLFRENGKLYLGILPANAKKLFASGGYVQKGSPLEIYQLKYIPNVSKSFPKNAFKRTGGEVLKHPLYDTPDEVLELYKATNRKEIAVKDYNHHQVQIMVDYYKKYIALNPKWQNLTFHLRETSEYERLNDFFEDVDAQSYNVSWVGVSKEFVKRAVEEGNLYFFEITCQDMSPYHHGKDGSYKYLIERALLNGYDSDIIINGNAAIYYRKPYITKMKVTHPTGVPIANKNPNSKNRFRTLPYDLIKDRRYTRKHWSFHIPVKIFPDEDKNNVKRINERIRDIIKANPDMYVLGINRGERSLVSIAVTAPDGTIVEQRNLNVFDNFDYRRKLKEREDERNADRRNWNAIRDIKNIKKGYLSRCVGEIARLVKKYGCVIAMEDFDEDFKDGRQKFEKNVYRQFERDVIRKFGLLMEKDDSDRLAGSLQLTNPDGDIHFQNGAVFFLSPAWISRTDPSTGFVNRINTHLQTEEKAEQCLHKFDSFRYNATTGRFELAFKYGNVAPEKEAGDPARVWTVETYGDRFEEKCNKGVWRDVNHNLTEEMKDLLDKSCIDYADGKDIIPELMGRNKTFYNKFFEIIRLTLQITSYDSSTGEFRVISCVADENGHFYDSRTAPDTMPKDADVNAAWNIARKAHIVLQNIRTYVPKVKEDGSVEKDKGPRLAVSQEEWFAKCQKND